MSARRLAGLCLFLFLLYIPTLGNGFQFDDWHMASENRYIQDWEHLPEMIRTGSYTSAGSAKGMYRPVLMASYIWNYQTGASNPIGYHLLDVAFHLLVLCFAVGLSMRLWPSVPLRWVVLGAAVWAAHPVHVEAVSYVSSRSSLLAALFVLLCVWLYAEARRRRGVLAAAASIASLAAYVPALGSKEIAVTVPGLILLTEWALRGKLRVTGMRLAPYLLVTAAYLVWRRRLFGAIGTIHALRPWGQNTRMQLEGILHYLRLWFWPVHQNVVHPQPDGAGIWPWAAAVLLAALAALAWRLRKRSPEITWALAWAGVTFLPTAFAATLNLTVAEHHLYLPSVGVAVGLGPFLYRLSLRAGAGPARRIAGACLALTAALGVLTFQRQKVWHDEFSLWSDAARKNPNSVLVLNNLGLAHVNRGQSEEAFNCYARMLKVSGHPYDEATARMNLGNLYSDEGQPEEALIQFRRCLWINPALFTERVYNNLGLAYADLGRVDEAEAMYVRALDADPEYTPAMANLAAMYLRQKRHPEAGRVLERAAALDPEYLRVQVILGKFYLWQGDLEKAQEVFHHVRRIRPRDPTGSLYLAFCALHADPPDLQAAGRHLARAQALGWKQEGDFLEEMEKLVRLPSVQRSDSLR